MKLNFKSLIKKRRSYKREQVNKHIKYCKEKIEEELIEGCKSQLLNIYQFDEYRSDRMFNDLAVRYIGRYHKQYAKKEHHINRAGYLVYKLIYKI